MKGNIGLIGLAVMGENLALNMESQGFKVSVYNRTVSKVDAFVSGRGKNKNFIPCLDLEHFVDSLEKPRKIMLMVKAGDAVDKVISKLTPLLDKGDVLIDGGNSNFNDTQRRFEDLKLKDIHYIGTGVSGGEEGALNGPSIMPGGSHHAWPLVKDILQKISAQVGGEPCCDWIGSGGAGHYVKMVHNGIEYGDMQLICESYHIMKELGLNNDDLQDVFAKWNEGDLNSYLVEITRDIFAKKEDGAYVVDLILDTAGQKGTGKWTAIESLNQGIPLTLINEAVYSRFLSALKEDRVKASKILNGKLIASVEINVDDVEKALFASKIVSYAQGFELMSAASDNFNWNLSFSNIAKIWRGGCIIRSGFLNDIMNAFKTSYQNLLLDDYFKNKIDECQKSWRKVVAFAVSNGIPLPSMSSALAYFDGYRSAKLPANLLQAQRDFFGAHTYERVDKQKGEFYHTNWTGRGGITHSSTYNA